MLGRDSRKAHLAYAYLESRRLTEYDDDEIYQRCFIGVFRTPLNI